MSSEERAMSARALKNAVSAQGVPEYIMCSVQQGSSPPVFMAVIYRPPDAELIDSNMSEALKQHSGGFAHRLVMGDLNANMLVTESESTFVRHVACQHKTC